VTTGCGRHRGGRGSQLNIPYQVGRDTKLAATVRGGRGSQLRKIDRTAHDRRWRPLPSAAGDRNDYIYPLPHNREQAGGPLAVAGDRNTIVWDATSILKIMAAAPEVAEDRN